VRVLEQLADPHERRQAVGVAQAGVVAVPREGDGLVAA
jgi:hypothetical protein